MTSIEPIEYEGKQIIPLQFLKAVLPDPASLGPRTVGKTNIGCIYQGKKERSRKKIIIYIMYATIKNVIRKLGLKPLVILQEFRQ